jgi:hypothetical protein
MLQSEHQPGGIPQRLKVYGYVDTNLDPRKSRPCVIAAQALSEAGGLVQDTLQPGGVKLFKPREAINPELSKTISGLAWSLLEVWLLNQVLRHRGSELEEILLGSHGDHECQ